MTFDMAINHFNVRHEQVCERLCQPLVHQYSSKQRSFYVDLMKGCFVSMTAEDNIAEKDLPDIWPQVEEADAKEIAQFVHEKAFQKILLRDVPEGTVIIDGTWVRRWKLKSGKRIIKSRMCARGCFDPQKDLLATRSTTASRLSQRLLVSTAAVMREDPESWDVSGAFLKGLTFDRIFVRSCSSKASKHQFVQLSWFHPGTLGTTWLRLINSFMWSHGKFHCTVCGV